MVVARPWRSIKGHFYGKRIRRPLPIVEQVNPDNSCCDLVENSHQPKMYEQILSAIRSGKITNADIAKATGIPLEKTGMLLRQMRDDGVLLSINRGKWTIRPTPWE
jgi:predicted Rossmann fold nucleotide-binding protein DprA/Smf involved in DNA uptake